MDTLFGLICRDVTRAKEDISTLKKRMENPEFTPFKGQRSIEDLEKDLELAVEALPSLAQVKEKFGGLRVYTYGTEEKYDRYIEFAESMSYRTCEVCGQPGKSGTSTGWIKTLCNEHHLAHAAGLPLE